MALYTFLLAILYKIISHIPVVILLITLYLLLVLIICSHHLSHLLSRCGITYQTVLNLLVSPYLRLTYLISKYCYLCSRCPFLRHKFHYGKKKASLHPSDYGNWIVHLTPIPCSAFALSLVRLPPYV